MNFPDDYSENVFRKKMNRFTGTRSLYLTTRPFFKLWL